MPDQQTIKYAVTFEALFIDHPDNLMDEQAAQFDDDLPSVLQRAIGGEFNRTVGSRLQNLQISINDTVDFDIDDTEDVPPAVKVEKARPVEVDG